MGITFALILAYLIGSIPNGLILGKLVWGIDLREHGSHNIGATNAWRTLGKTAGFSIFFLDLLKGVFGVNIAAHYSDKPEMLVLGGILAIVGHSWSLFLGFKGGKGVATGLGVILSLMPVPTAIIFLIWFIIVKLTGYVSLGSIVAAALVPALAWLFNQPVAFVYFGIIAAVFIIYRHKTNIERLINGTESKIKAGSIKR